MWPDWRLQIFSAESCSAGGQPARSTRSGCDASRRPASRPLTWTRSSWAGALRSCSPRGSHSQTSRSSSAGWPCSPAPARCQGLLGCARHVRRIAVPHGSFAVACRCFADAVVTARRAAPSDGELDVDRTDFPAALPDDPLVLASLDPNARWVTADYREGDVVVFGMVNAAQSLCTAAARALGLPPSLPPSPAALLGLRRWRRHAC